MSTAAFTFFTYTLPHLLPVARQVSNADQSQNETLAYLSLGALLGVGYSLGTEKFIHAMKHRHIFIRNAMLWLSAIAFLFAAISVIWIASLIYDQSGGGLEGYDRVLGVLIPFVVRADLVVDWAKRVAWALLNMTSWTQGAVQVRRLLIRARHMPHVVDIDADVLAMVSADGFKTGTLEDTVLAEDADSLVNLADVLQHFEKYGRVAVYAIGGLVGALPISLLWFLYAAYHGGKSLHKGFKLMAALYWLSLILTPIGTVVIILASTILLGGVVALSIVGTIIQFSVYWSTRTVYSMVRVALSQAWAGFPGITRSHSTADSKEPTSRPSLTGLGEKPIRKPEEAGTAIAQMGGLLPTELEFALASWDGYHHADLANTDWFMTRLFNMTYFKDSDAILARDMAAKVKRDHHDASHLAVYRPSTTDSELEAPSLVCDSQQTSNEHDMEDMITHADFVFHDPDVNHTSFVEQQRDVDDDKETVLKLLSRLGLDLSVKSARKRRLSTYYALAMLTSLQVESGGNAWRLRSINDISDDEFNTRIEAFDCIIADEAKIAVTELEMRLKGTSRYRIIPSGVSDMPMVSVVSWLRWLLLSFLETPGEIDHAKMFNEELST